ncbi:MAG: EamA family transporter [Victivallales bacterium]|nr:EamA family transporter [Victivallales bacterium]
MKFKHQILAVSACLLWSSAFVLVKFGLEEMPPFLLGGARFILAGLMLLPFLHPNASTIREIRENLKLILKTSLFQTIILYGLFFVSLQYVRGAQASIIIGSSPIVSAIVAHIMQKNDKLTVAGTLSILLGVLGVTIIVISSKPWQPGGTAEFIGILLLLLGSISSAVANVFVSDSDRTISPILLNSSQMFIGGVALAATGLVFETIPTVPPPTIFWWGLAGLAFISAAGFSIWFHLLGHVKVSKLNTWKFLIPVGGSILSWCFLPGEHPDVASVSGIVLICSAIVLCQRRN